MNSPQFGLHVASVLSGLICLGHLVRIVANASVKIGSQDVPFWASVVVAVISGALCSWFWRLGTPVATPPPQP